MVDVFFYYYWSKINRTELCSVYVCPLLITSEVADFRETCYRQHAAVSVYLPLTSPPPRGRIFIAHFFLEGKATGTWSCPLMATHVHLVLRLICGAIPPFSHASAWRDSWLSIRDNFFFVFTPETRIKEVSGSRRQATYKERGIMFCVRTRGVYFEVTAGLGAFREKSVDNKIVIKWMNMSHRLKILTWKCIRITLLIINYDYPKL
jgi:hypothetical protein